MRDVLKKTSSEYNIKSGGVLNGYRASTKEK